MNALGLSHDLQYRNLKFLGKFLEFWKFLPWTLSNSSFCFLCVFIYLVFIFILFFYYYFSFNKAFSFHWNGKVRFLLLLLRSWVFWVCKILFQVFIVLKPGILCIFLIHCGSLHKMFTALYNSVCNTKKSK